VRTHCPTVSVADSLEHADDDERLRAVATLTPYLLSYRSRMASSTAPLQAYSGGLDHHDAEVSRAGNSFGSSDDMAAVLVDTALLRALLLLPDSGALLRFVQRPNSVDWVASEAALKEAGRYAELTCLYQQNSKHDLALDLIKALSTAPESLATAPQGAAAELKGCPGVWHAVKYLISMESPDFQLVSAHAKWILQGDQDAGLDMFAQMRPPLSPSVVLPILTSYVPQLAGKYAVLDFIFHCLFRDVSSQQSLNLARTALSVPSGEYLESALESGAADREDYEHELAMIYLQQVTSAGSSPAVMPCYGRLQHLVGVGLPMRRWVLLAAMQFFLLQPPRDGAGFIIRAFGQCSAAPPPPCRWVVRDSGRGVGAARQVR
jgi:hypothetical protein